MVFEYRERIKMNPGVTGIALGGEGVSLGGFFLFFIGVMFTIIMCGFAIARKTQTKFFLWLCLVIVVETVAALEIG